MTINKKINIGIPTYNRPYELLRCLNSLLKAHLYSNCIFDLNIIVYDNQSSLFDDYKNTISAFKSKIFKVQKINFSFHVQKCNNYFDGNYISILKLIPFGEFFWILGDDDELDETALIIISRRINAHPCYVQWVDVKNNMIIRDNSYYTHKNFLKSADEFLSEVKSGFYLSAMIGIKDHEPVICKNFTHYLYFIQLINKYGGCDLIKSEIVKHNIGLEDYSSNWAKIWYVDLLTVYNKIYNIYVFRQSIRIQLFENFFSKTAVFSTLLTSKNLSKSDLVHVYKNLEMAEFITFYEKFFLKLLNIKILSHIFNSARSLFNVIKKAFKNFLFI